jgi:hypothetical protein
MCSRDRYLANLLPFTVQNCDVTFPGSDRHIHRDLSGDDESLIRGFLIIAALKVGRINQPVTVFHVKKVARHFISDGTCRKSNARSGALQFPT